MAFYAPNAAVCSGTVPMFLSRKTVLNRKPPKDARRISAAHASRSALKIRRTIWMNFMNPNRTFANNKKIEKLRSNLRLCNSSWCVLAGKAFGERFRCDQSDNSNLQIKKISRVRLLK